MRQSLIALMLCCCSITVYAQKVEAIEDFGIIKRNWAIVYRDECVGIVDKNGQVILSPVYD